ncbi:MAG TPA: hypothetical protein VNE60_02790 [Gemmatimonadaceae bacterium]|nr:hypothetical protein [Gemmatimonadaceae bacterium]
MRKLIIGLALVAGCSSGGTMRGNPAPLVPSNDTGALNPDAAVNQFMAAVKAEDLQAMGAIWGTPDGPARDQMSQDVLQQRELIMLCYLKHDSYKILGDAPSMDNTRALSVDVTRKERTHATTFTAVRGKNGRWYVEAVDIQPLTDFCAKG